MDRKRLCALKMKPNFGLEKWAKFRKICMPFHSVIVPTYNQEKYIGAALDSIIAQTDTDWETIIINDGSTDGTRDIIEAYCRRDSRIRCFHRENGGVASALNAALENVSGEWIHWLSSDDLFEPDKLLVNRRWIALHKEANFFFSYFTLLREATGDLEKRELWGPVPHEEHQILTLFFRNYISGISICVRRSSWEAVGFFDRSLHYAQDYDQWLRILQKNRGVFIPERTVISRNHAEQGSETFPAACYFDTAKAAIGFLNKHAFPELVPFANLADAQVAWQAVSYALDVACNEAAFLYSMGAHPALVLRVMEWVFSDACPWEHVRTLTVRRVQDMVFQSGESDWTWMWHQLALAIQQSPPHFNYQPVKPTEIAVREWQSRTCQEGGDARSIEEYLARFDEVSVNQERFCATSRARIVLLTHEEVHAGLPLCEAANQMAELGFRPVILTVARDTRPKRWCVAGRVPILSLSGFDKDTLPWLGDVELAVFIGGIERCAWLGSIAAIDIDAGLEAAEMTALICAALNCDGQEVVRSVVFLERVLKGGGAERVVLDLCKHLDRKRFKPEIWTMFSEPGQLPTLPDIKIRQIFSQPTLDPALGSQHKKRFIVDYFRRVYHKLLSPKFRTKIALGVRLRQILVFLRSAPKKMFAVLKKRPIEPSKAMIAKGDLPPSTKQVAVCDYIASAVHHQPKALALSESVKELPAGAALITVMEEAAVAAWMAQAVLPFPYIASLHTVESVCLNDIYREPGRYQNEKWLFKNACERAEVITVPTSGCGDDLVDVFEISDAHIQVISNPIDCARIRKHSFQHSDAVTEWVKQNTGFRLVHVGRLDPQKNHDLLLEACIELKKLNREFSLVIVGDGWARPNIEEKIAELGLEKEVTLAGEQENPFPWMAAADALMLTSQFEAFSLVLVEAMICGIPVVSVDCPVGPRAVLSDGRYGLLIKEAEPVATAQAITKLMDDPALCQQFTEKGYERALDFDVKQIVPLWEDLLEANRR